jgi:hypothetical protein
MTTEEFINAISSESFRREINHILWLSPITNKGKLDAGWSCREHALFLGVLSMLHGIPSYAIHGKATFVVGPHTGRPPVGISQDRHTWVRIEGVGSCDLSVRLDKFSGTATWTDWPSSYLLGSKFLPPDTTHFVAVSDENRYEQMIALSTHSESTKSAVYLQLHAERIGLEHVENMRKWCNSPLTDRLKTAFPARTDVYAKAVLHLEDFLQGRGSSVAELHQMNAWAQILKRPGNARTELLDRLKYH